MGRQKARSRAESSTDSLIRHFAGEASAKPLNTTELSDLNISRTGDSICFNFTQSCIAISTSWHFIFIRKKTDRVYAANKQSSQFAYKSLTKPDRAIFGINLIVFFRSACR